MEQCTRFADRSQTPVPKEVVGKISGSVLYNGENMSFYKMMNSKTISFTAEERKFLQFLIPSP